MKKHPKSIVFMQVIQVVVIQFILVTASFGQSPHVSGFKVSFDKKIEPSTSVSQSFKNFEDLSPSNNGAVSIPISLYKINSISGGDVPININYNATGIKVNQKSTDVGLGWNLNAGGSVQREVRGYPDDLYGISVNTQSQKSELGPPDPYGEDFRFFSAVGYDYSHVYRDYSTSSLGERELLKLTGMGYVDTKPDVFTLSLPNKSVRFVIKNGEAVPLEDTDLEISIYREGTYTEVFWEISSDLILPTSYLRSGDVFSAPGKGSFKYTTIPEGTVWYKFIAGPDPEDPYDQGIWEIDHTIVSSTPMTFPGKIKMFVVRDVDGTVYTLGNAQEAISDARTTRGSWTQSVGAWQLSYPSSSYHGTHRNNDPYKYSSAWDLSYICYPNSNETITFEYDQYYEINASPSQSLSRSFQKDGSTINYDVAQLINTFSYQIIKYNRVKKIKWNNGYLDFNYNNTDRGDISNILPYYKIGMDMNLRKEFDENGNTFSSYGTVVINGYSYAFCNESHNLRSNYPRRTSSNPIKGYFQTNQPVGYSRVSEAIQFGILQLIDPAIPFKRNALQEIVVRDNSSKQIKKVAFTQSYFGNATGSFDEKRLKLDKIEVFGTTSSIPKATSFEYNQPNDMPSTLSLEQDYWGYFNDNGALNLLPNLYYYSTRDVANPYNGQVSIFQYPYSFDATTISGHIPSSNQNFYVKVPRSGSDHGGHSYQGYDRAADASSMQIGVLNKVTYPTSGSRIFTYEPNEFKDYSNNTIIGGGLRIKKVENFEGTSNMPQLVTNYNYFNGKLIELPVFGYVNNIKLTDLGLTEWKEVLSVLYGGDQGYKNEAFLTISSHPLNQFNNQTIGYDKIESVTNKGKVATTYLNPISYLDYSESNHANITNTANYLFELPTFQSLGGQSSLFPIKGLNPTSPLPNYDWKIGLPLKTEIFKKNGNLAESVEIFYELKNIQKHEAISCAVTASHTAQTYDVMVSVPSSYKGATSSELSYWVVKTQERKKSYDGGGLYVLSNVYSEYNSSNHHNITKQTGTESNGNIVRSYFKYPQDYANREIINASLYPDITPLGQLDKLNIVGSPIETILTKTVNGVENVYDVKLMEYDYTLMGPNHGASLPLYDTDCTGELKVYPSKVLRYIGGLKTYAAYTESSISTSGTFDYTSADFETIALVENVNTFGKPEKVSKPLENTIIEQEYEYISRTHMLDRELNLQPFPINQQNDFTEKSQALLSSYGSDNIFASTSFEGDNMEKFTYSPASVKNKMSMSFGSLGFSGEKFYQLGLNRISYIGSTSTKTGYLTFRSTSSSPSDFNIGGASVISHQVSSNSFYNYYLHTVMLSGVSSFTIDGLSSISIDDLRLFTEDTYMVTTTSLPLVGITTKSDLNNERQMFEYDEHSRLNILRDNDGNIIETFKYNFKK
jgi:hypothetical protein